MDLHKRSYDYGCLAGVCLLETGKSASKGDGDRKCLSWLKILSLCYEHDVTNSHGKLNEKSMRISVIRGKNNKCQGSLTFGICRSASIGCAGIVDFLARQIDQPERRKFRCIPWVVCHVFHILLKLRIDLLFGDDQGRDGNRRGIGFLPLNVGVLDRRPFFIHKELNAKIEANIRRLQSVVQFLAQIILLCITALKQGPQTTSQLLPC